MCRDWRLAQRNTLTAGQLLLLALLWASAASAAPYSREDGPLWVAGNDSVEIAVSRETGTIRRLLDKVGGEDYCNQTVRSFAADSDGNTATELTLGERIGGLTLIDEFRALEFSDLTVRARIMGIAVEKTSDHVLLSFEKHFPEAEFVARETYRVDADHIRWDVRIKKIVGPPRTIRVIQFAPLPLGSYHGWAPISDAPFEVKAYRPFAIDYGQSISGAVGEGRWRTNIPMMVFYSKANKRAISFTSAFEVPAVRIRFLNNTGAASDFHWNSRRYPLRERPYFQISNEYLGARNDKDIHTSVLISMHAADWRPALGWVYSKYREYFDPDPGFEQWEGSFALGYPMMRDSLSPDYLRTAYQGRHQRGVGWEELHGHFPWYGLMIPPSDVETWRCDSHLVEGITLSRRKIAEHTSLARKSGVGTFLYYNLTEAENWYAKEKFLDSVAKSEAGQPIGAFRAERFPDKRACWLMNADPETSFGKHMIQQAGEMVDAYPAAAGFFWDVYGRSYMFDFGHDDGITMVNNKPAYYPEFMYQRMMSDHLRPLLRSKGMLITANKPVTVASCKGLDGIMAMEDAPLEESPPWITAQSFLGLNRHTMILENNPDNREMMYLHCLRYGMFDTDWDPAGNPGRPPTREQVERNAALAKAYRPFIERLRGRTWIFYPEALELPKNTEGNIFRLRDGSVMITMVSAWRYLRDAAGIAENLEVICRLPDAAELRNARATAVDRGESSILQVERTGDTIKLRVPRHVKATVILLSKE